MTFTGIPHDAADFYAELEDEFGPATIFRPNRDVRFPADMDSAVLAAYRRDVDAPRGWNRDHERIELLRHRTIYT